MLTEDLFHDNLMLCAEQMSAPGIVIECGVWRGGMTAGMATLLGPGSTYYLFDSFEGMPAAEAAKDGRRAAECASSTQPVGRLAVQLEVAEGAMRSTCVPNYDLVKGWFNDTLSAFTPPGPVAILRLNSDWYDDAVPGGLVFARPTGRIDHHR